MNRFMSAMELRDLLSWLKKIPDHAVKTKQINQRMDDFKKLYGERFILAGLMVMSEPMEFCAVVDGRGFIKNRRTIRLVDVHLFGIKFMSLTDHMWVRYTKVWERIEPFIQGQRVILRGKVIEYEKANSTISYSVDVERVFKT